MFKCDKCKEFGLNFQREYPPHDFFVGKRSSKVWIIGLNPKGYPGRPDKKRYGLEKYFDDKKKIHPYFNNFKQVSYILFDLFGKEFGAGHTDIVKCYSNSFPPQGFENKANLIIENCEPYLIKQLREMRPEIVICNGLPVCRVIKKLITPINSKLDQTEGIETFYHGIFGNHKVTVFLSGFIGRSDNYAKRRFGVEIETIIKKL